jgi:hypothetical protein
VHREVAVDPRDNYDTRVAHVEALRAELGRSGNRGASTKPAAKG